MKAKLNLEPGIKYRGYGVLNEYGEFEFIPEETGKNHGRLKVVKENGDFTILESKKHFLVRFKIEKWKSDNKLSESKRVVMIINNVLVELLKFFS